MNRSFTIASILNIDYLFNSKLKWEFVLLKCVLNVLFAILELMKITKYRLLYFILIFFVQIAHSRYDNQYKNIKKNDSIFYHIDPLYLISGQGVKDFLGQRLYLLYVLVTTFLTLYLIAKIQSVSRFYCYGDASISQYIHGVCPSKNVNETDFDRTNAICSVEDCLLPINTRPEIRTLITYLFLLTIPQWWETGWIYGKKIIKRIF